jgi:hypothetical protein
MSCLQNRNTHIFLGTLLFVGFLLTVILVPMSLEHVEYYEYGLEMRKTTGRVDTTYVYERGRYNVGPTYKFIKYQADAHFEEFNALSVFSKGASNTSIGLEFKVDVDFTYLLKKDEIGELHQDLSNSYRAIIESRAKDGIKNEAIHVSFTEYFQDRKEVEKRFRDAVQRRWDSTRVHCTLDQFHLGRIRIPDSVATRQLESLVQNERNDQEAYFQQAQLEREQTAVEVNSIFLEKEKILRTAQAEASLLRAKAKAQAALIKVEAQVNGTALLFLASDIVKQEHMTAYTYIRNLANREKVDLSISYVSPGQVLQTTPL